MSDATEKASAKKATTENPKPNNLSPWEKFSRRTFWKIVFGFALTVTLVSFFASFAFLGKEKYPWLITFIVLLLASFATTLYAARFGFNNPEKLKNKVSVKKVLSFTFITIILVTTCIIGCSIGFSKTPEPEPTYISYYFADEDITAEITLASTDGISGYYTLSLNEDFVIITGIYSITEKQNASSNTDFGYITFRVDYKDDDPIFNATHPDQSKFYFYGYYTDDTKLSIKVSGAGLSYTEIKDKLDNQLFA